MERYDRGEQEKLVLKNFRLKKIFLAHPKSPKTQKTKNFQKNAQKDAYYYKTKKCVGC